MFVLSYASTDPNEVERLEEEFDLLSEAQARACSLLGSNEGSGFLISDEDGNALREDAEIRQLCSTQQQSSGGGGGGGGMQFASPGRRRITITAAVFPEGFVVVSVRESLLLNSVEANRVYNQMVMLFRKPVLLVGGRRLHGNPNLVRDFSRVDLRRITGWRDYHFTI